MAFSLLAVVMCELLPRLQSTRISRSIAHEVQISGHPEDVDMTAVAYDEKLLACEQSESNARFITRCKDKPWVDYLNLLYTESSTFFSCMTSAPPPKPSFMLRNLTTHKLPDDVIGLIGSFNHDVHCKACYRRSFNMTFLEKYRTAASTTNRRAIAAVIGKQAVEWGEERTLQTCMASPKANQVAVCVTESDESNLFFMKETERKIKENEELVKKSIQEHQEFIKKKQENIADLQDDLDMRKQNVVYLKQMFEGPWWHRM